MKNNSKYYMIGDTVEERKSLMLEIFNGNILSEDIICVDMDDWEMDILTHFNTAEALGMLSNKNMVLLQRVDTEPVPQKNVNNGISSGGTYAPPGGIYTSF